MTLFIDIVITTLMVTVVAIIAELVKRHYHKEIQFWVDEYNESRTKIFELECELKRCKKELKKANLDYLQNSDRN